MPKNDSVQADNQIQMVANIATKIIRLLEEACDGNEESIETLRRISSKDLNLISNFSKTANILLKVLPSLVEQIDDSELDQADLNIMADYLKRNNTL
jgi:hypothetical protein